MYRDPKFTIRARAALIHASEVNVDKIMTDLEQSKKSSSQLKDTLRKEREENSKLKRKYEDMQKEMRFSKDELQVLQAERRSILEDDYRYNRCIWDRPRSPIHH